MMNMLPSGPVVPPLRMGLPKGCVARMVFDHGSTVRDTSRGRIVPSPMWHGIQWPTRESRCARGSGRDQGDQPGGEQSDGRLAWIVAVAKAKEDGENDGGAPEAGRRLTGLESALVDSRKAARGCTERNRA